MPRISELDPPDLITGLELTPILQGGGEDGGRGMPLLAYGAVPKGAVSLLRRPMLADLSSTSDSNPGSGKVRWNNVDPAEVDMLYVPNADSTPTDMSAEVGGAPIGSLLYLQSKTNRDVLQKWRVTDAPVAGAGYTKLPVVLVVGQGVMLADDTLELSLQQPEPSPGVDRNVVTAVSSVDGVTTLDASAGDFFVTTLTENTTLEIVNPPAAGTLSLRINQGATPRTVTMPASFRTRGGTPLVVTATAAARDRLVMTSDDFFATVDAELGGDYK